MLSEIRIYLTTVDTNHMLEATMLTTNSNNLLLQEGENRPLGFFSSMFVVIVLLLGEVLSNEFWI